MDKVDHHTSTTNTWTKSTITLGAKPHKHYKLSYISRHTQAVPHVSNHTQAIPHISCHTLVIPHVSCHTQAIPHVSRHTLVIPHVSCHIQAIPHVSHHTQAIPHVSRHTHAHELFCVMVKLNISSDVRALGATSHDGKVECLKPCPKPSGACVI